MGFSIRVRAIAIAAGAKGYGRGGIRTHGTLLTYTHFPGVRLKPLGHPSSTSFYCADHRRPADKHRVEASSLHRQDRDGASRWEARLRTANNWVPTAVARDTTDRERFELSIPGSPVCRFSRPVPSTTRPPVLQPVKLSGDNVFFNQQVFW
jgi:hypothetical protein